MDSTITDPAANVAEAGAARPPGRERLLIGGAIALTTAITAAVIGFTIGGSSSGYDEAAHRAAVEAELGHQVSDWATIADLTKQACAESDADLQMQAAVAKDAVVSSSSWDTFNVTVIGLSYRCPDRIATFIVPPRMPDLGSAAADQIRRATGGAS